MAMMIGMSKRLSGGPVVVILALTIAMCGSSSTWAHKDDAEYECIAGQGAVVGPICVKVESIGEDVLFT